MNCVRFFGFNRLSEVDELTIPEYEFLAKANRLKQVDADYRIHQLAFLNFAVQATKKNHKPVYTKFNKFFDYDKQEKKAKGEKASKRFSNIGEYFRKGGK